MKKFSTISKVKVDQEPKQEKKEISELDSLKMKLHMILDNYLSVRISGPIRQRNAEGSIDVQGKEHVIEAILDMFEETGNKKTIQLLESMKSEFRDHQLLDSKIEILMNENSKIEDSKLVNTKVRIQNLSERYKDDDSFKQVLSIKAKNMDKSLLSLLEYVDIPHNRRNLIKSYIIKEEAIKYDVEAAVNDIIDFNRSHSDDIDSLSKSISQNLGYKDISINKIKAVSSHLWSSAGDDQRIPEDRTLVRELYNILNESNDDEGLKVSTWVEENSPFKSKEDMISNMVNKLGLSEERAKYWASIVEDGTNI
jgi:hypothetical protein